MSLQTIRTSSDVAGIGTNLSANPKSISVDFYLTEIESLLSNALEMSESVTTRLSDTGLPESGHQDTPSTSYLARLGRISDSLRRVNNQLSVSLTHLGPS